MLPVSRSGSFLTHCLLQVRFSNDKTPYKQGFSASFSRSGRKGIFAHCKAPIFSVSRLYSAILTGFSD
jgi:uncharacterized protein (DUF2461 family)